MPTVYFKGKGSFKGVLREICGAAQVGSEESSHVHVKASRTPRQKERLTNNITLYFNRIPHHSRGKSLGRNALPNSSTFKCCKESQACTCEEPETKFDLELEDCNREM